MSARVLVVDDTPMNLKVVEARLGAEYYDVITAINGTEAIVRAKADRPDIILLDVMMPGIDGFETCRRLKADSETRHIPIIMLTSLNQREDLLRGLDAGADDFLTKPIDDLQLLTRVKSLTRLKVVIDELRTREANGRRMGVISGPGLGDMMSGQVADNARVLVADDNPRQLQVLRNALAGRCQVVSLAETKPEDPSPDVLIVSLHAASFDGLRVIAKIRAIETTRQLPILALVDADDRHKQVRSLDLGANDLVTCPPDPQELQARVRTLVLRRRYIEALRGSVDQGLELAVTDQLTGLYNRRFLTGQLEPLASRAARGGEPVSVLLADIDHFKKVNDTFGHDVGDEVLREFAARMASNVRPMDVACRLGGEEFVVIMPATRGDSAAMAAERLRRNIVAAPFSIKGGTESLAVTVSIGVATSEIDTDTGERILKRADEALYQAKQQGRNRVMSRSVYDQAQVAAGQVNAI